ncbi:MAG: DEAD/DEAH box helicase [Candidatus Omnitrophica bacterium]|nr:DEAD/DEAH box helicase [Candidatus Omnitrophota bacterium]
MTIYDICKKYKIDLRVAEVLNKHGYNQLYPPQETVLNAGALEGKNLVLSMPTASGKTLIAELCMLRSILESGGKCLYVVPLRALANEKYENLKDKYSSLGIKIAIATGDYDTPSRYLASYHIIVATSEKVDSLLRFKARWLSESLTVAVFDEIHLLNDISRGPTLEVLIARLKQFNRALQLIGLSATIKNAGQIAKWLGAECFISDWRPVSLKEGVYFNEAVRFEGGQLRPLKHISSTPINSLCMDTVKESGQVLVFVNTRRSTQAEARRIAPNIKGVLTENDKTKLDVISKKITTSNREPTKICKELSECVKDGVAFHHAGLTHQERKLVEDNFKGNIIKVICSTPTLAAGVNLPARRVIIRDYKRYDVSRGGSHSIAVFEYKQMRGRAGRPKYDTIGEAIIIAKSEDEQDVLFDEFINAESEPIISKLGSENALCMHILSSISSGYICSHNGLMDFLSHTFFSQQEDPDELEYIIERIIDFLRCEEMIAVSNNKYEPTPFGSLISRLYIKPHSGVLLKKGLENSSRVYPSAISLLHLICACPDMGNLRLSKKTQDEVEMFFGLNNEDLLLPFGEYFSRSDYRVYLEMILTTLMLNNWMEETKEDEICDKFPVGPGDIRRFIETAKWLLYSTEQLARLLKMETIIPLLQKLQTRVRYGIKEELLNLVSLKEIGRVRARSLYKNGIKHVRDIKAVKVETLMRAANIGKIIAANIKKQVEK